MPQIEDFGAPAATAAPIDGEVELSEEEIRRQEFLEGGGGLFPKVTVQNEMLKEDPNRAMIFGPGRGFGEPVTTPKTKTPDSGEPATVLIKLDTNLTGE
ncbi:hypothetical protein [Pelagibius sp. Alg239-R121]|uniref:hypothetical protein n=1 Tax=Pelagibius sp. Alg239-R121 TaxID=2993448 RepID=UPI0024A73A98|nr:hypothetical protein [Pelagibius sp. Alg239-R121]